MWCSPCIRDMYLLVLKQKVDVRTISDYRINSDPKPPMKLEHLPCIFFLHHSVMPWYTITAEQLRQVPCTESIQKRANDTDWTWKHPRSMMHGVQASRAMTTWRTVFRLHARESRTSHRQGLLARGAEETSVEFGGKEFREVWIQVKGGFREDRRVRVAWTWMRRAHVIHRQILSYLILGWTCLLGSDCKEQHCRHSEEGDQRTMHWHFKILTVTLHLSKVNEFHWRTLMLTFGRST